MYTQLLDSRLGNIFVILFATGSVILTFLSLVCKSQICSVFLIVPLLPWVVLFEKSMHISLPWAAYPLLLLANSIVVYSMGASLEYGARRLMAMWRRR